MRLKSFYAKTMTEAMHMVRETLGEDAVIVATREEGRGKAVRVTAAIDRDSAYESYDSYSASPDDFSAFNRPAGGGERGWHGYAAAEPEDDSQAIIETLTDVLLRHAVPDEIVDHIISCASVVGMDRADTTLMTALEHLYSYRPLPQKRVDRAFMMVGPPGAGKTLATAKLAARGVMAGLRMAVISTDTIRAGGIEQLEAFTKILRIPLQKAETPMTLAREIEKARGADQILIDTGGFNPFNPVEMRDLARLIAAGSIDPVLVLPGGIDADESGEMARVYAALGARSLLPTRLDIARRLGGLLGAAHHGSLLFADASNTPKVADGLQPLSPERLARFLMPGTAKNHATLSPSTRKRAIKTK